MIILTKANRNIKYLFVHSLKISNLFIKYRNFILNNGVNYYNEYKQFKDCYIRYSYHYDKLSNIAYSNYSGKIHREDGPAWINYYKNGEIDYKSYYLNGKIYSYKNYLLEIEK